jgi:excisionase family DNA binding protein
MDKNLRIRDVADILGIAESTVYALAARGALPVQRFGRAIRVPAGELEAWRARQIERPKPD